MLQLLKQTLIKLLLIQLLITDWVTGLVANVITKPKLMTDWLPSQLPNLKLFNWLRINYMPIWLSYQIPTDSWFAYQTE